MIWNRVAAILELLFVGKKATIVNAQPYNVIEYDMLKMKNKTTSTFLNTPNTANSVVMTEIPKEMMKASMTLGRVSSFLGLGFFITLKDLFTGRLEKEDFNN